MKDAAGSLAWIAILVVLAMVLARRGVLSARIVAALRALITTVTLPVLLFRAFLQLQPDGRNALLALAVFAACGVMGAVGVLLSRIARLPSPESRLLFQGFEAGMLGYALFIALHGSGRLSAFAALDMGQVVYVFTVLLVQMSILSRRGTAGRRGRHLVSAAAHRKGHGTARGGRSPGRHCCVRWCCGRSPPGSSWVGSSRMSPAASWLRTTPLAWSSRRSGASPPHSSAS